MNYRTRFLALLLAGLTVLTLTACSNGRGGNSLPLPSDDPAAVSDSSVSDSAGGSSSVLPDDFQADTSAADLCQAILGFPGTAQLLTVNGVPVTAYSYLYWLTYSFSSVENSLLSYGYQLDWDSLPTLAEDLKQDALNAAVRYSLIPAKARELGLEMTQEQVEELKADLALSAEMMGGEQAFQDGLRKAGLDYDTFYAINAASYYYAQLRDGLFADRPTDEEFASYLSDNDILCAKHILLMTVDPATMEPLDEETIAQKRATAEDLLARLQASGDLPTDFDTLMNQYSEDTGLAAYPDGYTFTAGEMVSEFETATRELEYGQISPLVESPYGYHIILRLDPDTAANRSACRSDLLNNQVEAWAEEAEIVLSDQFQALDARLYCEAFMAYQAAFAAESMAEDTGD